MTWLRAVRPYRLSICCSRRCHVQWKWPQGWSSKASLGFCMKDFFSPVDLVQDSGFKQIRWSIRLATVLFLPIDYFCNFFLQFPFWVALSCEHFVVVAQANVNICMFSHDWWRIIKQNCFKDVCICMYFFACDQKISTISPTLVLWKV